MVEGMERFKDAMSGFTDNYVIIGGTACDIRLSGSPHTPRPTRDIDMIVVVERLTREFVEAFWKFIHDGRYTPAIRTSVKGEHVYALYRFANPQTAGYPFMLELLSRHSELLGEPSGYHIEPIPDDEEHQSLSAIIMDEEVYSFTVAHSSLRDGLRVADTAALIVMKATAYLNLLKERAEGGKVNSDDIKKHRSDVLKLVASGDITESVALPKNIFSNIVRFREALETQPEQSLASSIGSNIETLRLVKRIVVSHHLPSYLLMDKQFKGSPLNGAFVSELFDIINSSAIDYWIFGHSHRNTTAQIGHCRCLSNQLGYVSVAENSTFDNGICIEIL